MKRFAIVLSVLASFMVFNSEARAGESLIIQSEAFKDGEKIPSIHACANQGGRNKSIPITWSNAPAETKSFAVIMDDPDAQSVVGYTWVHWNVFNIPATENSLPANWTGKFKNSITTKNTSGDKSFGGMCPPNGRHKYVISVYALNATIEKPPSKESRKSFEKKNAGLIISKGTLSGVYP